jgi:hypothetical protein
MWTEDSGFWIGEFEFKEFTHAVTFIDKVAVLAFNTELNSLWKERAQIAKIKVKIDRNSDCDALMKRIDNIYFQNK